MENDDKEPNQEELCLAAGFCMAMSLSKRFELDDCERHLLSTAALALFERVKKEIEDGQSKKARA